MKSIIRIGKITAIAVLALGASWLIAAATAPDPKPTARPEAASPAAESGQAPLPDFQPSEELPAGSAVAFPTDI